MHEEGIILGKNTLVKKGWKHFSKRLKKYFGQLKNAMITLFVNRDFLGFCQYIKYLVRDYHKVSKLKLCPPDVIENRITFESGNDFSDNARALFEYMCEHGYNDKYEMIWLVREPEKFKKYEYKNVKFVRSFYGRIEMRTKECYEYAYSSKYVIYVTAVNWMSVFRKNQVLINLWHGCGYKANKGGRKVYFDYCLVPGDVFIETKKDFFGVPAKKILPLGYPRYDLMLKESEVAAGYVRSLMEKCSADKMILWMPTYRQSTSERLNENTLDNNEFNIPLLVDAQALLTLDEYCRENKVLIVIKRHYLQIPYDFGDNVLTNIVYIQDDDLFDNDVQLYEFIHYSDALISDYSSVSVDYVLMDKPIGFALDDYEAYTISRGWVFDNPLDYMPGNHMYTMDDLKQFILEVCNGQDVHREKRNEIKSVLHKYDKDFCQRVIDTFGM